MHVAEIPRLKTEVYIVDGVSLGRIKPIDKVELFVWRQKFNKVGDFELRCNISYHDDFRDYEENPVFITHSADSRHFGVVEVVDVEKAENGQEFLVITGRFGESLFKNRAVLGETVFESMQPSAMMATLINRTIIQAPGDRRDTRVRLGTLAQATGGVETYGSNDSILLDNITDIAELGYLGFNLAIEQAISDEPIFDGDENEIGRVPTLQPPQLVYHTYNGVNRTEADNIEIHFETIPVRNLLQNALFSEWQWIDPGFETTRGERITHIEWTGWQGSQGRGLGTSDIGVWWQSWLIEPMGLAPAWLDGVTKTKIFSVDHPRTGGVVTTWHPSAHLQQNVTLRDDRLYFHSIDIVNNTDKVLVSGINGQLQTGRTRGFQTIAGLFTPERSGVHTFYAGMGDLPDFSGQNASFQNAVLIDVTETFGVGREPGLHVLRGAFFFSDGTWNYRQQVKTLVPHSNEIMIFSRDRDMLAEMRYNKSTVNNRTVCYVRGEPRNDTPVLVEVVETRKTGLQRREMIVNPGRNVPARSETADIPLGSYQEMLRRYGRVQLRDMNTVENVNAQLYLLSDKQFGRDFYLGDIVSVVDKNIGLNLNLRISETIESWNETGDYTIRVVLGDDIFEVTDLIKLVHRGAM